MAPTWAGPGLFIYSEVFDSIVKWQDNLQFYQLLAHETRSFTTRRGSTTEETARIANFIKQTALEISGSGDKNITDISNLSRVNRNEFTGVKQQWAEKIEVPCLNLIPEYNSFVGQVDNIGRLLLLYIIKIDSGKKFYLKFF